MESSSSSSSKHLPEEENQKIRANQVVSNCLIVLPLSVPQFIHASPSSKQPITPNFKSLLTQSTTHILHNFHNSIHSTADKCLKLFHSLASQNPFLSKVVSLSSDLQNFCQIHRRNYQNLDSLSHHNFAAILPGDSVAGVVAANGILNFLNIYNTLLVCRLVLTWFPNSPPAIVSPLSTLCDPYLNIFRGLIPPLGGTLDLSPILAFLVLNAFTSAASALPAELPSEGTPRSELHHLTTSQRKWMRRFAAKPPKSSSNDH